MRDVAKTNITNFLWVIFLFLYGSFGALEALANEQYKLDFSHYNVGVEGESGYTYIYDNNDSLLFRLGGYEQTCVDCFGDVFDKDSLTHSFEQTTVNDVTTLTFGASNSAIELTQIYEFDNSRYDFDYSFYYTFQKDMKMRDQVFLMDYEVGYSSSFDDGIEGWTLQDSGSIASIACNSDANYSRSGNSLHIMMNNIPLNYIRVKSPVLGNVADKNVLTLWVFAPEGLSKLRVMLASSTGDTNYKDNLFYLKPLMWNKIEWNYQQFGTSHNNFDINDVAKIIFHIHSSYFSSPVGHWYIDDIRFMKDNFENTQIFDSYDHEFESLISGARASYYAPRLLRTGFSNSDVSLLVSSRYSQYGQVEQIDGGGSYCRSIPHFYTFSMVNHRFKATHDDDGNYIGGSVLLDYDLAREGYTYGGKLNFNLKPPSNGIYAAKFPRGYEAAYTFTDDTDSSTEDTTKGTYYGTSDESDPNFGKRGFLGHDIKILATAFNYGSYANSWTDGSLKWLRELAAFGFEIGPHDFANVDDGIDRPLLNSLLNGFVDEFNIYTTVRHSQLIYSFCGLGRIEADPNYYWLDLFENAPDTKYIWSGGLEYGDRNAYGDPWELPHHDGRIDYLGNPKKIYIYGRESSMWGWIYNNQGWGIEWNPQRIDELIEQKGFASIYIHTRLASSNPTAMCYNNGSDWVIYDEADDLLGYLEQRMNEGDLWIEPPHVIFDYMLEKENINVEYDDSNANEIIITNYNDKAISGFTLEIYDSNISSARINNQYQIYVKNDKVVLPTLDANEVVCLELISGDNYDTHLPRILGISPNVGVNSAVFDVNEIIIDISATGRGYQENRDIIVDTADIFPSYNVYVDEILHDYNAVSRVYVITMPVTGEHRIVIVPSCACSCAEIDGSSPVNFGDYSIIAYNWQKAGSALNGDIDGSGFVDVIDLSILARCWLEE